jgi:DNA invertase Pin-like site-specific DNA recombinase
MARRAVIYIRTSSEAQGENFSPVEQEADCRRLAKEKGLDVVRVYRDVEKYRVGRKLVQPSGSRSDRPGLVAMLKDATRDEFDVILAWREDRLYRGLRFMLTVLETVQDYKIEILLAKENFDSKIAPVRAWAAQMELEGMKERLGMGVRAWLKAGKANTGQDRYGYLRVGDKIHIVEEEADWVRKIFDWYNQGVSLLQIRERLIAGNAPQKGSSTPRYIHWARSASRVFWNPPKNMHMAARNSRVMVKPSKSRWIQSSISLPMSCSKRNEKRTKPILLNTSVMIICFLDI